jgi:hypothetical protein
MKQGNDEQMRSSQPPGREKVRRKEEWGRTFSIPPRPGTPVRFEKPEKALSIHPENEVMLSAKPIASPVNNGG